MDTIQQARDALAGELGKFLSEQQQATLTFLLNGEEKEFIADKVNEYAERIAKMPQTYDTQNQEDPVAHLHYFYGSANWWITEKDMEGGVEQAFGWANLFGGSDGPEFEAGYIPIDEIVACGAELDLYWEPKPISQV